MLTTSRRWALVAGIAASVLLVPFAIFNRGQRVALDFGLWEWRGEAVYAVYGGIFVGLLAMFLLGLPTDLAARGERRRLARRVRELERDREREAGWGPAPDSALDDVRLPDREAGPGADSAVTRD
ncbi:MAG: lipopolysaccharide assembly protein LapA domain-containing protein [Gemmatimonadota bacterium]